MRDTLARLKAKHVMSGPVESVRADWPLTEVVRFFLDRHYTGAPVVDEEGRAVGVITLKDIARYAEWHLEAEETQERLRDLAIAGAGVREPAREDMHIDRMSGAVARSVMTPAIEMVDPEAPLVEVLERMLERRIHRIFVGRNGTPEAVISGMDVMRLLADYLRHGTRRHSREVRR